ncbi:MAG: abortive infection family protein [Victivallaceae bacterium]|nr:abortive infection family protein [Victivallaceae bacterium]
MNKLKEVIKEYGFWSDLSLYIERIEAHIESDFSHSLENIKALIEAIGKEICKQKGVTLNDNSTINGVMKQAFNAMGFSNSAMVFQISKSLANIGQNVGDLRNEIGTTAHGKSLEEIRQRNSKVDIFTREFLIDTIETVSVFLIRNFETKTERTSTKLLEDTLNYWEAEEFNESWDDSFGEFAMGDYSYPASEILFNTDKQAYVNEYKAFIESEE